MAIIYRTDGAWGSGQGSNLAPAQVDSNFYDLDTRVTYFEDNPPLPIEPVSITITGYSFSMGLSNGETIGPVTMTMPVPQWRGTWTPNTIYNDLDFFTAPAPPDGDGGFGAVMLSHTSGTTFDWAATSATGLPLYREIVGGSGATTALSDLIDVSVSGTASGDMLAWNAAGYWVNYTPAEIATSVLPAFGGDSGTGGTQGLVPAPAAGDAAASKFLSASGAWAVPPTGSGGGSSSLAGLTDVAVVSPATGHLLQYSAGDGKWHNRTLAELGAGTVGLIETSNGISGGPITVSGMLSLSQIGARELLANVTGGPASPAGASLSAVIDAALGTTRGALIRRDASGWSLLNPGTDGQYLRSGGSGADVTWGTPVGTGTVTSIATSGGISGGTITSTGTLSLSQIADKTVLANVTGALAVPAPTSVTLLLDFALGNTQGAVLYRGATQWQALAPGSAGQVLTSGGPAANPSWAAGGGGGGVTVTIDSAPPLDPMPGDLWWSSADGDGQLYIYYTDADSSAWVQANSAPSVKPRYTIGFSYTGGVLATSQLIGMHRVSIGITIPADFGAVLGHISQIGATANATASTVLSIERAVSASPNTFTAIGTVTVAAGGIIGTWATTGGAAVSVAQGDVLRVRGPATADATFANPYLTIVAQET
ncbi:MAG TPA: hypothetical protein VHM22_18590 [Bradyrhizobium sp.]|jgi:hypothetical protein|nr:hypothetical protein [Bradyrhizobium sp.]